MNCQKQSSDSPFMCSGANFENVKFKDSKSGPNFTAEKQLKSEKKIVVILLCYHLTIYVVFTAVIYF